MDSCMGRSGISTAFQIQVIHVIVGHNKPAKINEYRGSPLSYTRKVEGTEANGKDNHFRS